MLEKRGAAQDNSLAQELADLVKESSHWDDTNPSKPGSSQVPIPPAPPTPEGPAQRAEDVRDEQRLKSWEKLFTNINEALLLSSMVLERLNPDLALQYHTLSESLKRDTNKWGEFLSLNESFLPAVAVHFNMQPDDDDFHTEQMTVPA